MAKDNMRSYFQAVRNKHQKAFLTDFIEQKLVELWHLYVLIAQMDQATTCNM